MVGVLIVLSVLCFDVVALGYRAYKKEKAAEKALFDDCDASEALTDWRIANPNLYIGEVPYAQELVRRRIMTHFRLLETHPYIKRDDEFIRFLYSLLTERRPPPPDTRKPRPLSKPRNCGAFFVASSATLERHGLARRRDGFSCFIVFWFLCFLDMLIRCRMRQEK
ncbi:MAG: hypothetical protein HYT29_01240 [Parcubacteria group bacterium]|nr:hypothetical protein [Parcubacteria group bacterium]